MFETAPTVEKHMHGRKETTSVERSLIAIAAATLGLTLGLSLFPPLKWSKLARKTADWKPPRVGPVEASKPQCFKSTSIISRAKIRMSQVLMAMMMLIYDDGDDDDGDDDDDDDDVDDDDALSFSFSISPSFSLLSLSYC